MRNANCPLGHVPETAGHVAEIAGHDPETTGHLRPKYAVACASSDLHNLYSHYLQGRKS
jgi:hypothetical protein